MTDLKPLAEAVRASFTPMRGGTVEALLAAVEGHECHPTDLSDHQRADIRDMRSERDMARAAERVLSNDVTEAIKERDEARAERDKLAAENVGLALARRIDGETIVALRAENAALVAKVSRLRAVLGSTLEGHDTGHSPCACVEIRAVLKQTEGAP